MKSTELPALAELRESLREAAVRDIAARKPRRRRRRGIALFAAVLLGGAAAAGAADLISSGEPVRNERAAGPRYDSSGQLQLATIAKDKPLPWGVQIYTSAGGKNCALVGRIRGAQLGRLDADGKTFEFKGERVPVETGLGGAFVIVFSGSANPPIVGLE
jgi:hypothetical protein